MEGGNGATSGSGITHSPTGEQNRGAKRPSKSHAELRSRGGDSQSFQNYAFFASFAAKFFGGLRPRPEKGFGCSTDYLQDKAASTAPRRRKG